MGRGKFEVSQVAPVVALNPTAEVHPSGYVGIGIGVCVGIGVGVILQGAPVVVLKAAPIQPESSAFVNLKLKFSKIKAKINKANVYFFISAILS